MKTKSRAWYLAKKSVPIFPHRAAPGGGVEVISADFLKPRYRKLYDEAGPLQRAAYRLSAPIFRAALPLRLARIRRKHNLPAEWVPKARRIAKAHFVDAEEIAIHRIEEDAYLRTYVRRFEEARMNRIFNPLYWRPGCILHDKVAFADLCAAEGVPHPETYAICERGEVSVRAMPDGLTLFAKPTEGAGGVGATVIGTDDCRTEAEFAAKLRAEAGTNIDWVAQRALRNHPDLEPIAMNALSTMRVITILNEDRKAETVVTALKVATREEAITDNGAAGGLFVGIDPETALLGLGSKLIGAVFFEKNPGNGAQMTGLKVPFVAEARALACDVHERLFPKYSYIGWDVAITPDGPSMVEGNAKASMAVAQKSSLRDMNAERFCELLAFNLDLAERNPL